MSEQEPAVKSFSGFELPSSEVLNPRQLGEEIRLLVEEIPTTTGSLEETLDDGTFVYIRSRNQEGKNVVFLERNTGTYKGQPAIYRETFSWSDSEPEEFYNQEVHIKNPRSRKEPEIKKHGFGMKDLAEMNKIVQIISYIKRQKLLENVEA